MYFKIFSEILYLADLIICFPKKSGLLEKPQEMSKLFVFYG